MNTISIPGRTEIRIDRGLTADLLPQRRRSGILVVTQTGARHVAERVVDLLPNSTLVELPDGDNAKTLEHVDGLYGRLDDMGLRRDGTIVGVGGGSVTDLAGFAAATWLRGVEVAYVPTTLLGAVDASVGGKTGVNFRGKNLVGAFWHPTRVTIDLDVLGALPAIVAQQGWAEILKAGLIADTHLVSEIAAHGADMSLEEAVTRAVRVKADVVADDFRESGRRAILNFGHTIGHALEIAAGLTHGAAVAIGMVAEAKASEIDLGFSDADRVRSLVQLLGLPTAAPPVEVDDLERYLRKDKKADAVGLRMVLLGAIGAPTMHRPSDEAIAAAWASIGVGS